MIIGKVIKSILSAAGITAQPSYAAQGSTGNVVVYHVITNIPTSRKEGASILDTYRVQVNSVSSTFDGACTLSESIRDALDRYNGVIAGYIVDQIVFIDEMASYELEDRSHMIIQDYYIRVKDTKFSLFGYLYNVPAILDAKFAPTGWHVPTETEFNTLVTYLGGDTIAGGALKSTSDLWTVPNTGATNSSGFSAIPSGVRNSDGSFGSKNTYWIGWTSTPLPPGSTTSTRFFYLRYNSTAVTGVVYSNKGGCAVRLIRDNSTGWTAGDTITDEDNNNYNTVKIGDQIWTVQNWACTKLNDGTAIPNVTDAAEWAGLSTGAYCAYNNIYGNIFE